MRVEALDDLNTAATQLGGVYVDRNDPDLSEVHRQLYLQEYAQLLKRIDSGYDPTFKPNGRVPSFCVQPPAELNRQLMSCEKTDDYVESERNARMTLQREMPSLAGIA